MLADSPINSIWLEFEAPAGGTVTVTTDFEENELHDTHITIFENTGDCDDMTTLLQVGCDEDGGFVDPFGWTSIALVEDLTPGETYYVQVDGYNDLDGEFNIQIVTGVLGLIESPLSQDFKIFPNPANEELFIQSGSVSGQVNIDILDINGRILSSDRKTMVAGERSAVDVSSFARGFYAVRITTSNGSATKRLIVE